MSLNKNRQCPTFWYREERWSLHEDSLFTHLHPFLEPRHWWPSQCRCGEQSPKAAALWAHEYCSSHWPLWCTVGPEHMHTSVFETEGYIFYALQHDIVFMITNKSWTSSKFMFTFEFFFCSTWKKQERTQHTSMRFLLPLLQ